MPALLKKSITRSISKKWSSVTGGKSQKDVAAAVGVDDAPMTVQENTEAPAPLEYLNLPVIIVLFL